MDANLNLVFSWAGWKPGETRLYLWGGQDSTPSIYGMRYFRAKLSGRLIISVYSYNEKTFLGWWTLLKRFKPTIIYGYPSIISSFAEWLQVEGHEPNGIKGIFCTAEMLLPTQRRLLEQVFSCKVFNQYGSREAPGIACECPEGNMHIFVDINHVEFINGTEVENAMKRIIVTPLHNYAQPLLRYDLGDIGEPKSGTCPCGRGYPLMEIKLGRDRDHLVALDGRKVYPGFFTRLLDGREWVRSFQFRQSRRNILELHLQVENDTEVKSAKHKLRNEIFPSVQSMMGQDVELHIRVVESIERTPLGKYRYVINDLLEKY
jgi:phenylacetate-CoA ligase